MNEYNKYESDITDQIQELLECDHSDAEGILMAGEFYVTQGWVADSNPADVAAKILSQH